ncbi:MAG TPA: hypothetical protein VGJ32_00545 [Solirubrobacteraceae bacterium]|jgi:hypothetical protein
MSESSRQDIADQAAQAAREAAEEATTPEARFFLRQHANLLARIAAAGRRGEEAATVRGRDVAAIVVPLLEAVPS